MPVWRVRGLSLVESAVEAVVVKIVLLRYEAEVVLGCVPQALTAPGWSTCHDP
jgi:hypothetical protein